MSRWIWLLLIPLIAAFTPIYTKHDDDHSTTSEFDNVYDQAQARAFTVYSTTPALSDLRDGEIVILSSGTYTALIYRTLNDLWQVQGSCVTVRR